MTSDLSKPMVDDNLTHTINYIDGDRFTIAQLERVTWAHKNQVRN